MIDPKKKALKALNRKRKLATRKRVQREQIASGNIIMFGKGSNRMVMKKNPKKKGTVAKKVNTLPAYRAVILTARLDRLTVKIRDMDPNDPKLKGLKERRDIIKNKLK